MKPRDSERPSDRRSQFIPVLRRKPEDWNDGMRYLVRSGACVVYVGGNANNGGKAGFGNVNVNNGLTNSNTNIGARATLGAFFGIDAVFPHRRYWWIGTAHIRFSTSMERAGLTSAWRPAA